MEGERTPRVINPILILCVAWLGAGVAESLTVSGPVPLADKGAFHHSRLQITAEQPAPVIVHVGAVDHDILALEIEAQRTQQTAVQPYDALPGDQTKVNERDGIVKSVELIRGGKPVAYFAGKERRHVWFFGKLVGTALDTERADDPETYELTREGEARAYVPQAIHRKSKPIDIVNPIRAFPKRHYIYLKLPFELKEGQTYTMRMPKLQLREEETTFTFDPRSMRSEAIHVKHVGFRPGDPVKRAYLSVWLGNGGAHAYRRKLRFALLDHETGKPAFTGVVGKAWPASRSEKMKRQQNHSLTDVAPIDFSAFSKPGTFRICVEGIGCSYPFVIAESIWNQPFLTAMQGFYHQRSGIALGPPYSSYSRPRPYHPDDGLRVYASAVTLMETRNGLNLLKESNNFEALNRHVTGQVVDNAWGGYFDAADWDRRIQHLGSSRFHLELLELFPNYFADLGLNTPESNNAIPDLLDEALFNIDCYRRMQTPDGGIRGGIEAAEHPVRGETSWLESLRVMAYAPGPWSSYVYANVAARAAHLLRPYAAARSTALEKSARRAWAWAEANVGRFEAEFGKQSRWSQVIEERNLAALEFYRLTGEAEWHDLFVQDSVLLASKRRHGQRHAVFLYARLPEHLGQSQLKGQARKLLLEDADTALAFAHENAWGLASSNPGAAVGTGWFSTPDLIPLMRAYYLTGKQIYYAAIVQGISFSLGANPMNMTYTTGVGHAWPENAMVLDSRRTGQAVPEGITVFGQVDYALARTRKHSWHLGALDWFLVRKKAIYPDPFTWPVNESYWDIHQWPSACEFTPQSTMGKTSYMWGVLAAQAAKPFEFPAARPEQVGLDETKLAQARRYALSAGGSGMIIRHGKVVSRWGDQQKRYDIKSATKSFGATMLGIAIQDGKIELDAPARRYHPSLGVPPQSNMDTEWLDDISIRHLAAQTAGFAKRGGYQKLLFKPGTQWHYSDGGPNWLAECITLQYRRDLEDLMFERVFTPLGLTRDDLSWRKNQYREHEIEGIPRREFGAGIHANVEALARLGLLYLHKGRWQGQQILSANFVDMARQPMKSVVGLPEWSDTHGNASGHYSLLWWNNADGSLANVPRDAYWAWGLYDSLIVVMPSLDLVLVRGGARGRQLPREDGAAPYDVLKPLLGPVVEAVLVPAKGPR